MVRSASRTTWAVLIVLAVTIWAGTVSAQPAKRVAFKKGQIQFKMGGASHTLSLIQLEGASSFDTYTLRGKQVNTLGLVYEGPKGSAERVHMAFGGRGGLSGPGKYGKAIIDNLAVQAGFQEAWNYSPDDNCNLVFTRLDASGVEGMATCTTAGGKAPFTDMKFTASPG